MQIPLVTKKLQYSAPLAMRCLMYHSVIDIPLLVVLASGSASHEALQPARS